METHKSSKKRSLRHRVKTESQGRSGTRLLRHFFSKSRNQKASAKLKAKLTLQLKMRDRF